MVIFMVLLDLDLFDLFSFFLVFGAWRHASLPPPLSQTVTHLWPRSGAWHTLWTALALVKGQWPSGRVDFSEPGGSIPRLGSRRSSLISIEHAELLRSTPSLVLCCTWLVTMALHVHCGLGQLSPLPTSRDDEWVAAKHCGRAKRSRISDTHRLRSSSQFLYINNQSLLLLYTQSNSSLYCSCWNVKCKQHLVDTAAGMTEMTAE